jgi:hypothetical protein
LQTLSFLKCSAVFFLNGRTNGFRITIFFWKRMKWKWIKKTHRQTRQNWTWAHLHPQNDVLKTSKSQRHPQRCHFLNSENLKGHQKTSFCKKSALGPSKNGPQERFGKQIKKQWKNDRKMIDRGMRKSSLAQACVRNSHFRRFSKSL